MSKITQGISSNIETLTEDMNTLFTATADVAEETVAAARHRLSAALKSGKIAYGNLQDKAIRTAGETDAAVHNYPYHVIGIAFAAGALIGFLVTHCSKSDK